MRAGVVRAGVVRADADFVLVDVDFVRADVDVVRPSAYFVYTNMDRIPVDVLLAVFGTDVIDTGISVNIVPIFDADTHPHARQSEIENLRPINANPSFPSSQRWKTIPVYRFC